MPNYLSPGVYMEEVDRGTKPIEAAGTAVAAFIGFTERASEVRDGKTLSLLGKATLITNWSQYVQKYGGFIKGAYTPDAVYGYFANGGGICYVISLRTLGTSDDPSAMTAAQAMITADDGKTNSVRFVARQGGPAGNNLSIDLVPAMLESGAKEAPAAAEGEPADAKGKAKPAGGTSVFNLSVKLNNQTAERFTNLSLDPKSENYVKTVLETQSVLISAEVVGKADIVPAGGSYSLTGGEVKTKAVTINDYRGDPNKRLGLGGLEPLDDVTMVCVPDLMASYQAGEIDMKGVQGVQQMIIDYCEAMRYCFAILDTPPGLMPQDAAEWRKTVNYDTTRAALYYPWIEIADMTDNAGRTRTVPPSGHMAGIYARVDNSRGVHKAPANEVIRTAIGLEVQLTKGENDILNPLGVNAIRSFPGRGIRVWGARTLSSDASWRYINVRRLFSMVEASIERGTQWVVFEPNDEMLWGRVKRDVSAFLKVVWRTGALFGSAPSDAFYVKCDAELNPPEQRDLGQLVVEIGIAPVKPAEFVIFRISQWSPEA